MDENGHATIGFENSAVYQDAADAFDAAQRSIVATVPGSLELLIDGCLKVHDRASIGERASVVRIDYRASACGQNDPVQARQTLDRVPQWLSGLAALASIAIAWACALLS